MRLGLGLHKVVCQKLIEGNTPVHFLVRGWDELLEKKNQVSYTLLSLELFYLVDLLSVPVKTSIVDNYLKTSGLLTWTKHQEGT